MAEDRQYMRSGASEGSGSPAPFAYAGDGPVLAALDLGTNNCRLLIARPASGGFRVIDGYSRIVRLGEGLGSRNVLSEAAMARAITTLSICAAKIARRGATLVRCVATEAARRAENCDAFIARVASETGLRLEPIPWHEEAELTLTGCLPLLDHRIPYALVFDVGGGSAEFIWLRLRPGEPAEIVGWMSLPCGVVTLTERNGSHDFTPEGYQAVVDEVAALLAPLEEAHGIRGRIAAGEAQVLGTAGTVTTIAGVKMGLRRYNRAVVDGSWLALDSVYTICRNLAASSFLDRASHPAIGRRRADLVVAGCAVLEAVCRTWPAGRLRVADRGVREGILLHLAAEASGLPAGPLVLRGQ